MKKKQKNNLTWFDRILFAIINFLRPQPTLEQITQLMDKKETEEVKKMPNVYKLDGSTNVKMGTWFGKPALFIRPMLPKDPVNHSHEERHLKHMCDLEPNEQVILLDDGQDLGQLYMAMRQPTSHARQLHRGEDMSVHVHTHPSTGEQAVDKKFKEMVIFPEMCRVSEPGIQVARRYSNHGDERVSGVSTEIVDGLMHITETHVKVVDPKLGRGCSTSTMIIDPPPEVAEAIYEAQTGRSVTDEQRQAGKEARCNVYANTPFDSTVQLPDHLKDNKEPPKRANLVALAFPSEKEMDQARSDAKNNGTSFYDALHSNAVSVEEKLQTERSEPTSSTDSTDSNNDSE